MLQRYKIMYNTGILQLLSVHYTHSSSAAANNAND
jgi:hypothetical protein